MKDVIQEAVEQVREGQPCVLATVVRTKQTVVGSDAHPFYQWIAEEVGEAAAPAWNFHKYLVAPDGNLAGIWPSKVSPRDKELADTIESVLAG